MKFNRAMFEPLVNEAFTLQKKDGQIIELKLAGITSHRTSPRLESFTLNFDPPRGEPALPDDSYVMATEGFGPTLIFVSATHAGGPDPYEYYYESVFNVFREENP